LLPSTANCDVKPGASISRVQPPANEQVTLDLIEVVAMVLEIEAETWAQC